jgi:hypothetical protein
MSKTLDFLLACKYAYYVKDESLVSDSDFDLIEKDFKSDVPDGEGFYLELVGFKDELFTESVEEMYEVLRCSDFELFLSCGDNLEELGLTQICSSVRKDGYTFIPCVKKRMK